jgi:hypothetical protein
VAVVASAVAAEPPSAIVEQISAVAKRIQAGAPSRRRRRHPAARTHPSADRRRPTAIAEA